MTGALSHIRVLDLSRVLAGPWATQLLADLGAEVIKVEKPGVGDDTRHWGPPYLEDSAGHATDRSAYFLSANRGKKSLTIDITTAEGQDIIRQLAAKSDVLIENYKVGGLKKYGLDYDSLKAVNPGLVYCSITGFGQDGPYAAKAGYDFMIQALGGLMSLTGEPGGAPQKVGVALADILTGLYAANAVQAALIHRETSGQGQWIDMSLLDVQVATLANQALNYLVGGRPPERLGNAHPNIVPYQAFPTGDGHMIVTVGNNGQFARFAEVAGKPEWATDPRYATNPARVANRDTLIAEIETVMTSRSTDVWLRDLEAAGVPCGPINTLDQVFDDPQVRHRGLKLEHALDDGGTAPGVACPVRMSATPTGSESPPPALGQHTDEVLADVLGLDHDAIAGLRGKGVV